MMENDSILESFTVGVYLLNNKVIVHGCIPLRFVLHKVDDDHFQDTQLMTAKVVLLK